MSSTWKRHTVLPTSGVAIELDTTREADATIVLPVTGHLPESLKSDACAELDAPLPIRPADPTVLQMRTQICGGTRQ
jgi:hypothetical protein